MTKYLKDRRNGELYGWNFEMAKLPWMKEVEDSDKNYDDGQPDSNYDDPDNPAPQAPAPPTEDEVLAAQQQGEDALDESVVVAYPENLDEKEPPWAVNAQGERLYTEDGEPLVYTFAEDGSVALDDDGDPVIVVYELPGPPSKKRSKK